MFAILVVLLLLCMAAFPMFKRLIERYLFLKKLRRICRLKRYNVTLIRPLGGYVRNRLDPCAVTVDTGKTLYAISFWSEYYAHSNLIFSKNGNIIRRRKESEVFSFSGKRSHRVFEKCLTNMKNRSPIVADSRTIEHLFLIFGEKVSLFLLENKQLKKLNEGDKIYDMLILSPENTLDLFKNRGKSTNKTA